MYEKNQLNVKNVYKIPFEIQELYFFRSEYGAKIIWCLEEVVELAITPLQL